MRNIIEPTYEGADIRGTGFCRHQGLYRRENQCLINPDSGVCKNPCCFQALRGHGNLYYGVFAQLRELLTFADHALCLQANDLQTHRSVDHFEDLLYNLFESPLLFGNQRRVGRHAVDHPQADAFLNFVNVCRINKKFHAAPCAFFVECSDMYLSKHFSLQKYKSCPSIVALCA